MTEIVSAYLNTWNAPTPEARTALLNRHWAADATYTDPLASASGHDGISAVIGAVHEQFPEFVFSQVGAADGHHSLTRFQWGLGPAGEAPVVIGFDVVLTDDAGRIRSVLGFLDLVPA